MLVPLQSNITSTGLPIRILPGWAERERITLNGIKWAPYSEKHPSYTSIFWYFKANQIKDFNPPEV
jgi:hypothetical protein